LGPQKRAEVAEAVKHFMVDNAPGWMIARMLRATATLEPPALGDFVAAMLQARWVVTEVVQRAWSAGAAAAPVLYVPGRSRPRPVPTSQRPDALSEGTTQACEFLATLESRCQQELVAFLPRLLDVAADHEALMAWMRCLAPLPHKSWARGLSRFRQLQENWEEPFGADRRWKLFVSEILPMQEPRYKMYLWAFNQLCRPDGHRWVHKTLLIGLTRLRSEDIPTFVYTIHAFDEPELQVGEPFQLLVGHLSNQTKDAWEECLKTYGELRQRYVGWELVPQVLALVRPSSREAQQTKRKR